MAVMYPICVVHLLYFILEIYLKTHEISAFFSLVIDETIKTLPSTLTSTGIRCFKKGVQG
jgi:hypothetical protein